MTPDEAGLYGFVVLVVLMFPKIPVGFVMAIVGFCWALPSWSPGTPP